MTDALPTRHKGRYSFRLACPSFIVPAGYAENVERLGPCVDEIELLLLESAPENLPSAVEIEKLRLLGHDNAIVYNVHLPTDISPGADDPGLRDRAVEGLLRAIDRARPLTPVSYTLHIPLTASADEADYLSRWRHQVGDTLEQLLAKTGLPSRSLSVETLDYPLDYLDSLIREFDLSICLDTGHLMVRGADCRLFYRTWQERINILHLHGVHHGRDHLSLDRLSAVQAREIGIILADFNHSVSLEVFSLNALTASLDCLEGIWQNLLDKEND